MEFHDTLRDSFIWDSYGVQMHNLDAFFNLILFSLEVKAYKNYCKINGSLHQATKQLCLHLFQWSSANCRHHCEHYGDTDWKLRSCPYKLFWIEIDSFWLSVKHVNCDTVACRTTWCKISICIAFCKTFTLF